MKKIIITFIAIFCSYSLFSQESDQLSILFWNLENFFDYHDGGKSDADNEFSSLGSRRWTKARFLAKCNAIAKSVLWIADEKGRIPDIIAVAEVENRYVLEKLLSETILRKYDYQIVHYDSPDPRGIDLGILYRKSSVKLKNSSKIAVKSSERRELLTRDILQADFSTKDSVCISLLVNHHPSKYGDDSQWKREAAMASMIAAKDSLLNIGNDNIIVTGDFNEQADNIKMKDLNPENTLVNLGIPFAKKGQGTIRYDGKWEMIDMFMVSPALESKSYMEIVRIPFLNTWDNVHAGEKPLRTYSGPRYLGGVSDHYPILFSIFF